MLIEKVNHPDKVRQRPGQSIDFIADDRVDLAGLNVAEQPLQRGAIEVAAREAAIVEVVVDSKPAFAPLALDVGEAGLTLRIQRIERLAKSLLGAFATVDRTADLARRRAHLVVPLRRRPKNNHPFHLVPAISLAT